MAKLIEAMNHLKLTERKLASKIEFLKHHCARPSFRDGAFGGKEKEKIAEAVQSAKDLVTEHEKIKRCIDYTNLMAKTTVRIAGAEKEFTLHSLILHKRVLCGMKKRIWSALDERSAQQEIEMVRMKQAADSKYNAQVILAFDLESRDKEKMYLDELETAIDSALQIANSKIDLMDPDAPAHPPVEVAADQK